MRGQKKTSWLSRSWSLGQQLKQSQVASATAEKRVKELEERVGQLREQMNNVKSNKEYSAILVEVNTVKVDLEKHEEAALTLMGRVDMFQKELTEVDQKHTEQLARVKGAKGDVDTCLSEVDQELGELQSQKDEAEKKVPADAISTFNQVANIHSGETLAEVVEVSRRTMDYSCGGCYMSIPVERVNALISNHDNIVCCPSCGRILYVDQEVRESVSGK